MCYVGELDRCLAQAVVDGVKGSSQVENGTGRLPCLIRVNRSSSTAATTCPSSTRHADESWNAALMPRVYIRRPQSAPDATRTAATAEA